MEDGDARESEALEMTGKTVDEAIDNGLAELGLERHEVAVEVVKEGRAGLFGIGGEPALVRLSPTSVETPEGEDNSGRRPRRPVRHTALIQLTLYAVAALQGCHGFTHRPLDG